MTTAAITKSIRQEVLPPLKPTTITLETLCKVAQSEIDAMSFKELDGFVDLGIHCIALNQASIIRARQAMKSALIRIHDMLTENSQGVRNDLKDVPVITWTTFCHNKKMLGCKRTLDELIKVAGLENPNKQPKLTVGNKVVLLADGKDHPVSVTAEVTHVHEKSNPNDDLKIDVCYKKDDKTVTETAVPTTAVEIVKTKTLHLSVGVLVILDDIEGGAEFRYDGGEKLTRTDTPSKAEAAKLVADEKKKQDKAAKLAADEKKKQDAATKKKEKKEKAAAKKKEKEEIAAAAKACAGRPKANGKRRHKAATKPTRPFIAQKLGDKFFVFEKGEVEISIRTAKSSQFDTRADAVVCANGLNQKYGFEATI
jgi:hypothetical protein